MKCFVLFVSLLSVFCNYASCVLTAVEPNEDERIHINELARTFPFDNPEGGAWRQGWPIILNPEDWTPDKEKLQVFVVPHSHNDPGWLKTFDNYFVQQTKGILNTVVDSLTEDSRRHFIWAEMSFFDKWWKSETHQHEKFRNLLKSGRFEFVTGGWVMNDEATSHYHATVNHLTEGHEWLRKEFGVKPTAGWSIDPFGYSPVQAHILSSAGFEFMLIQRVHYALKKYLAEKQSLEFVWRQLWARGSETDILTHLMPFYSYDIPHTCGPEPAVCSLFEFSKSMTAWGGTIVPIDAGNLALKSQALLDQYRKKSELYRTRSVLAPLGDDFTYPTQGYADIMFTNHQKIHDYLNNDASSNVKIQFSNLTNYFRSVATSARTNSIKFPILGGDFHTYADREQDYWSGYFTSRSFFKGLDRITETTLRTAEFLHVIARILKPNEIKLIDEDIFAKIQNCRRTVSLFQHHDGVTGTAKPHVVQDYASMLHKSRWEAKEAIRDLKNLILQKAPDTASLASLTFHEQRTDHNQIPPPETIHVSKEKTRTVVVFNPLPFERRQVISIIVSYSNIRVVDTDGIEVLSQLNPVFEDANQISTQKFELFFLAVIPSLGFNTYFLEASSSPPTIPDITLVGVGQSDQRNFMGKPIQLSTTTDKLEIANKHLTITIDPQTGLMNSWDQGGKDIKLKEDFLSYRGTGGAYLFLPTSHAQSIIPQNNYKYLRIIKGQVVQESQVVRNIASRRVRLYQHDDIAASAVDVINDVHVTQPNMELVVRYSTDLNSAGNFYTDLNGFQMARRKYRSDKPIQFNFYPVTTAAFVQDEASRFTVHTRQAMGTSSLSDGDLELMLDRRLQQDDNRGLGEGVEDNNPHQIQMYLVYEVTKTEDNPSSDLSSLSNTLSLMLNHPVHLVLGETESKDAWTKKFHGSYSPVSDKFSRDLHFIAFKPRDSLAQTDDIVLQITKLASDPAFGTPKVESKLDLFSMLSFSEIKKCQEHSLTLMYPKDEWTRASDFKISPREIKAFVMKLSAKRTSPVNPPPIAPVEPVVQPIVPTPPANLEEKDPSSKTLTDKLPETTPSPYLEQISQLQSRLNEVEREKQKLQKKLAEETLHSKNNRFLMLLFVVVGAIGIFVFRQTKSIIIVFLISMAINVLVPLFLLLPEVSHQTQV